MNVEIKIFRRDIVENGRLVIISDLIPNGNVAHDRVIIPQIINNTLPFHKKNVDDIARLVDYYYNKTDIELKTKTQQPQINNKIGVAYANMAVTTINAYCFANPLTFASRSSDLKVQDQIKAFNDALDDDNYSNKTAIVELNSGMCGVGYKYIKPASEDLRAEGRFFETVGDLDPQKTYIARANNLKKDKILAIHFYEENKYDEKGVKTDTVTVYNVWTKTHYWIFEQNKKNEFVARKQQVGDKEIIAYPLVYKRIPIVEYPRKQDRTSDFEIGLALINGINALASSRVDNVQQNVDYILLLRDIDTESEGAITRIKEFVQQGILSFSSNQNAIVQPDVSVLDVKLNQSEIQTLQDFLCDKLEEVLNIPNRETRSSGGDTGSAVESRNGFRSLENIAGLVTLSAKEAENETLDIILSIASNYADCPFKDLKARDIEIKSNRNVIENLTTNTNAYSALRSAGMNDIDALTICRLTPDAISTAKRNEQYQIDKENREKEKIGTQTQVNKNTDNNNGTINE